MTNTTKIKSLQSLIDKVKCYYVNSDLTEINFPRPEVIQEKKWKLIKMEKIFSSQEALDRIKHEGCRPANAWELALWASKHAKNEMPEGEWSSVVAFGQTWKDADGRHRVPYVYRYSDGDFKFDLGRFESDWYGGSCLLCFCDSSLDSKTLEKSQSFDPLDL